MKRTIVWIVLCAAWFSALAFGIHSAMTYEATPGRIAVAAPVRPTGGSGSWTAILVAHPQCPCTTASLTAFKEIAKEFRGNLSCRVVFAGTRPTEESRNMVIASEIPDASVEWVTADEAASQFHSYTSGQTFVYDPSGALAFTGGVTPGRGVDQPRYAIEIFRSLINDGKRQKASPVYGCPIQRGGA